MGRYTDIANEWLKKNQKPLTFDGHQVAEIIWETEKMVIFKDPEGKLWRRVHAWGMTWPIYNQAEQEDQTESKTNGSAKWK